MGRAAERGEDLDLIRQMLQSPDGKTRGEAASTLYRWAQREKKIRPEALSLFQSVIPSETDPRAAITSAQGINLIAGNEQARSAWLKLLADPNPRIAGGAASVLKDEELVPQLLQLLETQSDPVLITPIMYKLSQWKYSAAFEGIVRHLESNREMRPSAIEALRKLGDPRAIPHLFPMLDDKTDAWEEDNHGPTLRVCDLAESAIRQLDPTIPAPAQVMNLPKIALPAYGAGMSSNQVNSLRPTPIALFPIIAGLLEIPIIIAVVVFQFINIGAVSDAHKKTHWADAICLILPTIGVMGGLWIGLTLLPQRKIDRVLLIIGYLLCGIFVIMFSWEWIFG